MIMNRIIKKLFISLFLVASTGICFAESYKANLIRGWPDAVLSESQVQDYADDTCLLKDGSNADTTIDIGSEDLTTIGTITADTFTDSTLVITGGVITNATNTNWDLAYAHIAESGASHTYINQDVTSASSPTFDGTNFTGIPNGALDGSYIYADGTRPLTGDWAMGAYDLTGGIDATFSGTVQAEQLTSTDDANITDALSVGGNLDVDGTANLDEVDIDGTTQIDGTLTVGTNGTGYDVTCYGASSGSRLEWQADTDTLKVIGGTGYVVTDVEAVNLEGPVDVNGNITLDKTTIYGPTQSYSSLTVGEDTSGYDVKFYGTTTGNYLLWDESADDLLLVGTTDLICDGTVRSNTGFNINGASGWSGWFDDGTNFRVTVTNGIITAVNNTVSGGHSP